MYYKRSFERIQNVELLPIKITSVKNMSFANSETKKLILIILMHQFECGLS